MLFSTQHARLTPHIYVFVVFLVQITMVKVHMKAAASKTRLFKALQDQAPVTLKDFVAGYRGAMSHIPLSGVGDV